MSRESYPLFSKLNGKDKRVMDYIIEDGIEKLEYKVKNTIIAMNMHEIQEQINSIKNKKRTTEQ